MDEISVPPIVELQVAEPKYLFEAKTIQRMELLVLTTLNWQKSAITPFAFVDYFICKINDGNPIPTVLINKGFQLILCATKGIDCLSLLRLLLQFPLQ